jgi:conjugal transfer pilus assembly protein TraV
MRIWIAPWIDKNDDLHLPSFLYTEVQARKWNLGEQEFAGNGVSVPHRVTEMAARQAAVPVAAQGKSDNNHPATHSVPAAAAKVTPQPQDDLNLGE